MSLETVKPTPAAVFGDTDDRITRVELQLEHLTAEVSRARTLLERVILAVASGTGLGFGTAYFGPFV